MPNGWPVTNDSASEVRRICPPPSPSEPSIVIIVSILRSFATRRHFHEPRHELTEYGDEVALRFHHVADIFVRHWDFIQARADECDALLLEKAVHVFPIELLVRGLAAHRAASAV